MNLCIQYILKPILVLAGLSGTGVFFYQAMVVSTGFHDAMLLFASAVGILTTSTLLLHAAEWVRNPGDAVVRVGHLTHSSEYETSSLGDESWKNNYLTASVCFPRPRTGRATHQLQCHMCPRALKVEVWSHSRALRNKLVLVIAYITYGLFWFLLAHQWPGIEAVPGLVGLAVALLGILAVFPGILVFAIGLGFLFTSWSGTTDGVGSGEFLYSSSLDTDHQLFNA